jgi:hypothetical protein
MLQISNSIVSDEIFIHLGVIDCHGIEQAVTVVLLQIPMFGPRIKLL